MRSCQAVLVDGAIEAVLLEEGHKALLDSDDRQGCLTRLGCSMPSSFPRGVERV